MAVRPGTTRFLAVAVALAGLCGPAGLPAQTLAGCGTVEIAGPDDPLVDYLRIREVSGARPGSARLLNRPSDMRRDVCPDTGGVSLWSLPIQDDAGRVRIAVLPATFSMTYNSAYPVDRNNGAPWTGRGATVGLSGGFQAVAGPVTLAVFPTLAYQANRPFATRPVMDPDRSPFSASRSGIDWPQRFGAAPYWTVDPGQTVLRVDGYGATAGVSTENLWWGPALRYPLMMSNTAPGFPHLFLGTTRPVDIWIGRLEARLFWAQLRESTYFDVDASNDRRLFGGLVATFEPRWVPGLYVGGARVELEIWPTSGLSLQEVLTRPWKGLRGNPASIPGTGGGDNGLLALYARWVHPLSGFEVWAEWGRDDHWYDLEDLYTEPDHSQVYTLGFQKVFTSDDRQVRLAGELTHLEGAITDRSGRGLVTFYTHSSVGQGYTQDGQMLGSYIGPGSDAQYLALDVFETWGRFGGYVERVRPDTDWYDQRWARNYGFHGHDVELTAGARGLYRRRGLEAAMSLSVSRRKNRNFIGLDGANWDFLRETNWRLELSVAWHPAASLGWMPHR